MKIKPSTFLLALAAVLLGGVTLMVVQTQPEPPAADQTEQPDLFAFEEKQVQALTLDTETESLQFQRQEDGTWQMLKPESTPASDPSIAFLLDLMSTGKSDRTLTAPAAERSQFGLDQPLATIEVKLENGETHRLILGNYDFNRSFIYALVDPPDDPNADLQLSLVSPSFENAVTRPLSEWKQPKDSEAKPSPSPEASPAGEPQPSPEASPSPQASPSPEASPAAEASPPSEDAPPAEQSSPEASPAGEPQPSPEASVSPESDGEEAP